MVLVHGSAISSEDIERFIGRDFGPARFAALCNAVAWASAGRSCSSLPSFTERVNVRDKGIDAQWEADFPDDGKHQSPLLGPGWNVSQYKQRDVTAAGREKVFEGLRKSMAGAVKQLHDATKRRPNHYVLYTNIDLSHAQKQTGRTTGKKKGKATRKGAKPRKVVERAKKALREAILEGYDQPEKVHVEIVGAAELAVFLNDLPHIRSAFFCTSRFQDWRLAWQTHTRAKIFGANVALIGREEELKQLQAMVDEPNIRVIFLYGPSNIGKTRLAFEGTRCRPIDTVVALNGQSTTVQDLLDLRTPWREVVVIVEDPDRDAAKGLVDQALANKGLKLLITLPTPEHAQAPSFGRDDRVQTLNIPALSDQKAHSLLEATGAEMDYSLRSWIVNQSGGNPGVLLVAAGASVDLRQKSGDFLDRVAHDLESKLARELCDDSMTSLRVLSLLSQVGVRGSVAGELERLCELFGDGVTTNQVLNSLPRLERAGVINIRGAYAEVVPPLLANYLAATTLRGRPQQLNMLLVALPKSGRLRLMSRLRTVCSDEAATFWDSFFEPGGVMADPSVVVRGNQLLHTLAGPFPERVAQLVEQGLACMTREERLKKTAASRRELVHTLDELACRQETSASALRSLALLGEAETESFANNATGDFAAFAHPCHPQAAARLGERLQVLRDCAANTQTAEMRLVAVHAIASAFGRHGITRLHPSEGPVPLDAAQSILVKDIWDYYDGLIGLLFDLASTTEQAVSKAVCGKVAEVLTDYAYQGPPEGVANWFRRAVQDVVSGKLKVPTAPLAVAIDTAVGWFEQERADIEGGIAQRLAATAAALRQLQKELDGSDFVRRLREWTGSRIANEYEDEIDSDGQKIQRGERHRRDLAREAVTNPAIMTAAAWEWLLSPEARSSWSYIHWLGRLDDTGQFLVHIEQLAKTEEGIAAFTAYFSGASQRDPKFVSGRLDHLAQEGVVRPDAIAWASSYAEGDARACERLLGLISAGRIERRVVASAITSGRFIFRVGAAEFAKLLALIGQDASAQAKVIDALNMRVRSPEKLDDELTRLAWKTLEAQPKVIGQQRYHFDLLAAHLVAQNPDRAFALLAASAGNSDRERWDPLDSQGGHFLWSKLREHDRERAYRTAIEAIGRNSYGVTPWRWRERIPLHEDGDTLVKIAAESEERAVAVAGLLSITQPEFWRIAFRLVEAHPGNADLEDELGRQMRREGIMVAAPLGERLLEWAKEVEHKMSDPATPATAQPWLRKIHADLVSFGKAMVTQEESEDQNYFRRIPDDPRSPERLTAIKALLEAGQVDAVARAVGVAELLSMLSSLGLSEDHEQKIRRELERGTGQ